jgi:hypothetical protein
MALPINSSYDLAEQLDRLRRLPPSRQPCLLGFFLFDDRRSHGAVLDFARRQYRWLNALAAANRMILFFFLPEADRVEYENADESVFFGDRARTIANPSLEVARAFDLEPDDLPGVIFFTELDLNAQGPHDGVYWPIDAKLFADDAHEAEDKLAELFSAVQQACAVSTDATSRLAALQERVPRADERARTPEHSSGGTWVLFQKPLIDLANMAAVQSLGI